MYGLAGPRLEYMKRIDFGAHTRATDLENAILDLGLTIDAYNIGDKPGLRPERTVRPPRNAEFLKAVGTGKYASVLGQETVFQRGEHAHKNALFRRKCKAGLEWALLRPSAGKPQPAVHFILDGLGELCNSDGTKSSDWSKVLGKNYQLPGICEETSGGGLPFEQKVRSITNAELRWIYRHRDNPLVAEGVQFWRDSTPVMPPWVLGATHMDPRADIAAWEAYRPRSAALHVLEDTVMAEAYPDELEQDGDVIMR